MAKLNTISFSSRASVKIRDSYYTFEYGQEVQIEDGDDISAEKHKLVDECNNIIDCQIQEIVDMLNKR